MGLRNDDASTNGYKIIKFFKKKSAIWIFLQWSLSSFSVGWNLWKHCIFPKKAFLWVQSATVDLSPIHTQHFLPHPELKLLPVPGQPFPLPPPIQKQPTHQGVAHRPSQRAFLGTTITFRVGARITVLIAA